MIDLHCHLLPGVDDGSRTVQQSVSVLETMVRQGVKGVCLTPHFLASRLVDGIPTAQDEAYRALAAVAPTEITLYRGAEVMLDRPIPPEVAANRRFGLGRSRYMLVEFPRLVAAATVKQALALLAETGVVPLLAHPERYVCCAPEVVRWWRETGALMQVDATTLLSPRGRGERARRLVSEGLADVAAADNHGDGRSLTAVYEALSSGGGSQADLLTTQNPQAIVDDQVPSPVPPIRFRPSVIQRLRRLFETEDL